MKTKRVLKGIAIWSAVLLTLVTLGVAAYIGVVASAATLDESKLDVHTHTAVFVDRYDKPMGRTGDYATIDEIPPQLVDAFVAVEDKRFYRHNGLDYRRIAGALLSNIRSHSFAEGASTISCQLIKNTHLSQEKTIERKIKEAKLARELEKEYTKDEIMEMYLNIVYMGSGLYGVKAAANGFFAKDLRDLSLAECASIAATTVNPSEYSPKLHAENNKIRRDMVLRLMKEQGYISEDAYIMACEEETVIREKAADIFDAYKICALEEACRLCALDAKALATGYTIYTYCDADIQRNAVQTCDTTRAYAADNAVLYADSTGEIRAYASNFALPQGAIRRQIGSTIKPFVYAAAIENNLLLPDTVIADERTAFGDYTPNNYHDIYKGNISARTALAESSNVAAVKVLTYVGVEEAARTINAVGLPIGAKDKHLAMALGGLTYGCTFDELTTAYCTLANGGVRNNAAFVRAVADPSGQVIYTRTPTNKRVLSIDAAYLLNEMLCETVRSGTAKRLGALGMTLAAKTGTVEAVGGNSDAWCVAYNTQTVALAWAGNLSMESENMTDIAGGGTTCTQVRALLESAPVGEFNRPNTVIDVQIDDYSYRNQGVLHLASPNTPDDYRRVISVKADTPLPISQLFEKAPQTEDCNFTVSDGAIHLHITPDDLCTYNVYFDNGYEKYLIDTVDKSSTLPKAYQILPGHWSVVPILHGKHDLAGEEYRVLIL